jgi:rubrerythrin
MTGAMTRKASKNQAYGQSMGLEKSPERRKREAARRKRQEKRWARKSGQVETRFECPVCGGPHPRSDCPTDNAS